MSELRPPGPGRTPAYVSGVLAQLLEDLLMDLAHAHDRGEIRGTAVAQAYAHTDSVMRELLGDAAFVDRTRAQKLREGS